MVLARLLPPCEIVGIELEEKELRLARLRAEYLGRSGVQFLRSPSGDSLPDGMGLFDYVIFSAVFEHLLPDERPMLLQKVWQIVKPGGILFLNQTPYRYSPLDTHTTGLPLINYLPDSLALWAAKRFSKHVRPHEDWNTLLRRGIRGGTVPEVLGILSKSGKPLLLRPAKRVGDRIDLWYGTLSPRYGWIKKTAWIALKAVKAISGVEVPPTLMLAIRKDA
jgi:SAM-dependent methyltransferase